MTLAPDLEKYPPSLWRVQYQRLYGLDFNPWPMMPLWMHVAARLTHAGLAFRDVHHSHACTAREVEEMLQLCGALTAAQTFAKVQADAWRRWVKHGRVACPNPEMAKKYERSLRVARSAARRLVRRAECRWRLYRCGFWLARKLGPIPTLLFPGADTMNKQSVLEAWGGKL